MNIEDLKHELSELGIDFGEIGKDGYRDALVAQLAGLHPDRTGGVFQDEEQKNHFLKIKSLLDQLDSNDQAASQLIPINQVVTLLDVISKLQPQQRNTSDINQVEVGERYKSYLKRKYALPKITSALVAGLCFMLFSLLGSFRQNALYRSAVESYAQDSRTAVSKWGSSTTAELEQRMDELAVRGDFAVAEVYNLNAPDSEEPRYSAGRYLRYSSSDNPHSSLENRFRDYEEGRRHRSNPKPTPEPSYVNINLFESTEPDFLRKIKPMSAQLSKDLANSTTYLGSINPAASVKKREKDALVAFLGQISSSLTVLDADVKSAEEELTRRKNAAVKSADGRILWRLALLTGVACSVFVLLWVRERSDERWVDFLATDEGAEAVLTRLCANSDFMTRRPPGFSLTEFTKVVGEKDIPRVLAPVVGAKLDVKRLGKISSFLLAKLKAKKVISERTTPSLQTWFDVHVKKENTSEARDKAAES